MNEIIRTSIYVGAAFVSLGVAWLAAPAIPKAPAEFSQVGNEFFKDFKDANDAKSLLVVTYNPDTAAIRRFAVEQGADGVWRIPSRHNYPVDGKDRLAKTATSIMGLKRDALAGQRKSQFAEFGVIDPLSETVSDFKGVGNRVTLKDGKDGNVLADLIVGKEVKGRPGFFYVREPNEDQTYIAKVSLDLSTKFTDWIEPDLLKLDSSKLRSIVINKHSIEISPNGSGKITGEEINKLSRTSATDKWKLDGLDNPQEEVNEEEVRKLVQALDDMKIVGVRPKSDRLKKQLEDDKGLVADDRTRAEMQDMGFYFIPTKGRRGLSLITQEGDVFASTDQGVVYDLHFGSVFSGTEDEIEAGFINSDGEKAKDKEEKPADGKDGEQPADAKKQKSRYLFVQAAFDPEAIGPKPTAPVKPEAPAEENKTEEADADQPAQADIAENSPNKPDPQKAYITEMAKYEFDQKKYETDLKAYEEKIKAGEKQVKELNRRFAEWYYVISGDSFENLRQGRKTLVKEKSDEKKPEASINPLDLQQ